MPWDPSPAQGTCRITKTVTLLVMRILDQDLCGTNNSTYLQLNAFNTTTMV